jgi:hypothetical protein
MKATYTHDHPIRFRAGKWEYERRVEEVTVMYREKVWAMVRRKGRVPFVVRSKELSGPET